MNRMRFTFVFAALAIGAVAGCDSSSTPAGDAGLDAVVRMPDAAIRECPMSDGTVRGDCEAFACLVLNSSIEFCNAGFTHSFDCTGVETFPESYQTEVRTYFSECGAAIPGLMDTEVPVMGGGTVTATRCQILGCAIRPNGTRPMSVDCFPVPDDCSFPNPPM